MKTHSTNIGAVSAAKYVGISNDGQKVVGTTFWNSSMNDEGYILASVNAGAIRLLMPHKLEHWIPEMATGKKVIVTIGYHYEFNRQMVELVFEDYSDCPFVIHLSLEQCLLLPAAGKTWRLTVWKDNEGIPTQRLSRNALVQTDPLPCLKQL